MPPTRVYIVGAGAVGAGFAKVIAGCAGYELLGVWTRSAERRASAGAFLGRSVDETLGEVGKADVVLAAVRDTAVADVGAMLRGRLREGAVIAHTAGALPASALGELPGCARGSLHPILACPDPATTAARLRGAAFTVEGDATAVDTLFALVRALEGRGFALTADAKGRYHAGLVLASNLAVALLHVAQAELNEAGLAAPELAAELTRQVVELAYERGSAATLTGPIVRGDSATVRRHLELLSPKTLDVYRALSQVALDIARARGLSEDAAQAIAQALAPSALS